MPETIFWAQVRGSLTPLSSKLISSLQQEQQAAKGLKMTKIIAHRNPMGQPNTMRIMNQMILQSHPQLAILKTVYSLEMRKKIQFTYSYVVEILKKLFVTYKLWLKKTVL